MPTLIQLLFIFATLLGMTIAVFSAVTIPDSGIGGALATLVGVAVAIGSYLAGKSFQNRRNAERRLKTSERLERFESGNLPDSMIVRGSAPIIGHLGMIGGLFIGAWYVLIDRESHIHSVLYGGGGLVVAVALIIMLPATFAQIGKPLIELTSDGFRTPKHGFIPWDDVKGIFLSRFNAEKIGDTYRLHLRVPTFRRYERPFSTYFLLLDFLRLTSERNGIVLVVLKNTNFHPQIVESTANHYWKNVVGYTPVWVPSFFEI